MEIHQGDRAPARSHGTERVGSGISLVDAVYGGITKQAMIWDDTSGHRWAIVAINVLRASLFALLTAVLVQQADRIDSASRAARWIGARCWPTLPSSPGFRRRHGPGPLSRTGGNRRRRRIRAHVPAWRGARPQPAPLP